MFCILVVFLWQSYWGNLHRYIALVVFFCDDIGAEQSCAPRRSRALWWLPTFGGDTDKGSSQWHLCMIKIKIKKEIIYCWLAYTAVENNSSSNHLSRFLSSPMCKQLWNMLKTPNSHKLWYLQEEKDKQILSARTKNAEFLKTGGNNLQSQHLAASSSLYANIFKFSRHIPAVCYILVLKIENSAGFWFDFLRKLHVRNRHI